MSDAAPDPMPWHIRLATAVVISLLWGGIALIAAEPAPVCAGWFIAGFAVGAMLDFILFFLAALGL